MEGLSLLQAARSAGLEVRADGAALVVRGPRSAEPLAQRLLAHKAEVLSLLTLPGEARPIVAWATWLVERVPAEEIEVHFQETPQRQARLKLSELGRYVTQLLGAVSRLRSWEIAGSPDTWPDWPGWRQQQINELCGTLSSLREALRPFGLAEIRERAA